MSRETFKEPASIPVKYIAAVMPISNEDFPSYLSFNEISVFIRAHPATKNPVLRSNKPIDKKTPLNLSQLIILFYPKHPV